MPLLYLNFDLNCHAIALTIDKFSGMTWPGMSPHDPTLRRGSAELGQLDQWEISVARGSSHNNRLVFVNDIFI